MVSQKETIDTHLLKSFVAVATYSGVTAAAQMLGLSKSSVSKHLDTLEALLQVRLFERSSRRVLLTREGQTLLPRAESIIAELDQFVVLAQEEKVEVSGTVRIAASPEFGSFLAEHFLPLLLERYPSLKVLVALGYGLDDLQDPSFDLAFRLGGVSDERLVARPLGEYPHVLVCSAEYAKAHKIQSPEDLERVNALVFSSRKPVDTWRLHNGSDPTAVVEAKVSGNLAIQGFGALAAAASTGIGVARLPVFLANSEIAAGRLVRVLPEWQSPTVPVNLVYRSGMSGIGRVHAVLTAALREIPAMLGKLPSS
ncbi:hypothetical protein BKM17_27365 [Pseudomonas syringae group genomosp. 3]|nr:hypothetical protein BKM17_27365 [Pseudomonas syringae group genomosp. 3]